MRGTALVLTVAFVFASTTLLLGHAAGQGDMPPQPCCDEPGAPDATLSGVVLDGSGDPVAGATVSATTYGYTYTYTDSPTPEPAPAPEPASNGTDGNGTSSAGSSGSATAATGYGYAYPCCGRSNSTVTGEDGSYSMGVWSGDVQVSVYRDGFASTSATVRVEPGQDASQDFTLKAFPAKTAHLAGKVVDAKTGKGLGFASVSVRSPLYGLYECSWTDADRAANSGSGSVAGGSGSAGSGTAEPAKQGAAESGVAIMPYPYYNPGCALSIHSDGSFEGNVTPGYSIVSIYAYQDCSTSRDADGSSSTSCGPEYLPWTRTLTLPGNQTTRLDIKLPSRPAPDATVSGYLVDVESGKAIPGATISFSNQDTYAYGSATTDQDGSYSLRLRSGYHSVWVYANGFLSWEGTLQVAKGESSYDVQLTPGQDAGGGCCIAYALDGKAAAPQAGVAESGGSGSMAASSTMAAGPGAADSRGASGGSAEQYQDLGGGLGPYDASQRHQALAGTEPSNAPETGGKGSPGAGLLVTGLAVGLALLALRRRLA